MVHNLLSVLIVSLCASLPLLLALPITSKPYARSPDHLAWDTYGGGAGGGGYGDDSLEPSDGGYGKPKKILPKSIFIAPTLQNSVQATCGPGYTTDHRGNCIQTIQINHNQLLLDQLNILLATHQSNKQEEDIYDYDYDFEATSPATKEAQVGPFQLSIPVQLEVEPLPPQNPDAFVGSTSSWGGGAATASSQAPSPIPTTTAKPQSTLVSFFDDLFSKNSRDPFGFAAKLSTTSSSTTVATTTAENYVQEESAGTTHVEVENTTSMEDEGETSTQDDDPSASSLSTGGEWNPSEISTDLVDEQLVPVTTTSDAATTLTTSDDDDALSNTEGTTPINEENMEVATEFRDKSSSSSQGAHVAPPPTTTGLPEVTETVLPYQQETKKPFPTLSTFLLPPTRGILDWQGSPISIVTPVSNPFPFGSRSTTPNQPPPFRFSALPTLPSLLPPRPSSTTEAPPSSHEILGVENESENSQKLRESLIESEQKEVNYENIDVNNRFIYHHLNGLPAAAALTSSSSALPPTTEEEAASPSALSPLVADNRNGVGMERLSTAEAVGSLSSGSSTTDRPAVQTKTPTFAEKLAALLKPKESERRVAFPSFAQPASTTAFPIISTTTSRFEDFMRSSSNRIRFPGPSVNRQAQPNKLFPSGQVSSRSGGSVAAGGGSDDNKEKKPFWWFPSGWEVDTKQKEKPVLLRFWSKMPLIPDNVVSQRRSSNYSRNNRENSKSPSENLYREVAIQDISKAFQGRQAGSGARR